MPAWRSSTNPGTTACRPPASRTGRRWRSARSTSSSPTSERWRRRWRCATWSCSSSASRGEWGRVSSRPDRVRPVRELTLPHSPRDALDEQLQVAQRQRLRHRSLVGEELVDRADRHLRPVRDAGGRQAVVPGFVEDLHAGIEHALYAFGTAALGRASPQGSTDLRHALIIPCARLVFAPLVFARLHISPDAYLARTAPPESNLDPGPGLPPQTGPSASGDRRRPGSSGR